ncbi:hypothetical protein PBI_TRISCUIT_11 [Microbacterium phage Triscuit]|nr:hypothetical protein PBI_TRISCUIT_11 [Microbacterium phage Triscuit]
MTETYVLLDKGTIDPDNIHEDHYVTYTTPSPQDKDWSLTFTEASSPPGKYYYAVWRYINDETAREEYPIFNRLASARNWAPVESRPIPKPKCPHTSTSMIGHSAITRAPVYRCDKCHTLVMRNREPIASGHYVVTAAPMISDLQRRETERLMNILRGKKP